MRLDQEQQYRYNRYLDYLHVIASDALSLTIKTEEKVRQSEKIAIARKLIKRDSTNEKIAKAIRVTIE